MTPKEAVQRAKTFIVETFGSEGVHGLSLEEIVFDDTSESWNITLSFIRDKNEPESVSPLKPALPYFAASQFADRIYRVVNVRDSDGRVSSVRIRDLAA